MAGTSRLNYVIDASYILSVLLPDEKHVEVEQYFQKYIQGEIQFFSTTLMPYEVTNALHVSVIRKRLTAKQAQILLKEFLNLDITQEKVDMENVFALSQKYSISAYDASYLSLSKTMNLKLLSFDKRLIEFAIKS